MPICSLCDVLNNLESSCRGSIVRDWIDEASSLQPWYVSLFVSSFSFSLCRWQLHHYRALRHVSANTHDDAKYVSWSLDFIRSNLAQRLEGALCSRLWVGASCEWSRSERSEVQWRSAREQSLIRVAWRHWAGEAEQCSNVCSHYRTRFLLLFSCLLSWSLFRLAMVIQGPLTSRNGTSSNYFLITQRAIVCLTLTLFFS